MKNAYMRNETLDLVTYCVFWINNCSGIKLDEICVGAPQCGSRVHVQSLPERDGDNVM